MSIASVPWRGGTSYNTYSIGYHAPRDLTENTSIHAFKVYVRPSMHIYTSVTTVILQFDSHFSQSPSEQRDNLVLHLIPLLQKITVPVLTLCSLSLGTTHIVWDMCLSPAEQPLSTQGVVYAGVQHTQDSTNASSSALQMQKEGENSSWLSSWALNTCPILYLLYQEWAFVIELKIVEIILGKHLALRCNVTLEPSSELGTRGVHRQSMTVTYPFYKCQSEKQCSFILN